MAPTTAMAEMALVIDISGVCSSRETRVITPRPMKLASMKTNNIVGRSGPAVVDASGTLGLHRLLLAQRQAKELAESWMGDVPCMGHERLADDFVIAVQNDFTLRRQI